jgi:hypothetical protein
VLASETKKQEFLDLAMDVGSALLAKNGKTCQDFFCKKVFISDYTARRRRNQKVQPANDANEREYKA